MILGFLPIVRMLTDCDYKTILFSLTCFIPSEDMEVSAFSAYYKYSLITQFRIRAAYLYLMPCYRQFFATTYGTSKTTAG